MKVEKAKMRRIGGFLMEILVLVFVFSYTHSDAESTREEKTSANQETPSTQFLLGDLNIPASSKNELTSLELSEVKSVPFDFAPGVLRSVNFPRLAPLFSTLTCYYTYTTINAP